MHINYYTCPSDEDVYYQPVYDETTSTAVVLVNLDPSTTESHLLASLHHNRFFPFRVSIINVYLSPSFTTRNPIQYPCLAAFIEFDTERTASLFFEKYCLSGFSVEPFSFSLPVFFANVFNESDSTLLLRGRRSPKGVMNFQKRKTDKPYQSVHFSSPLFLLVINKLLDKDLEGSNNIRVISLVKFIIIWRSVSTTISALITQAVQTKLTTDSNLYGDFMDRDYHVLRLLTKHLSLEGVNLFTSSETLYHFYQLNPLSVRVIEITFSHFISLERLSRCTQLHQLLLHRLSFDMSLTLPVVPSLKQITLNDCDIESVDCLYNFQALENVSFSRCFILNDVSVVSELKYLRNLSFASCIQLGNFSCPATLPALHRLSFGCCSLEYMSRLSLLPKLEFLEFIECHPLKSLSFLIGAISLRELFIIECGNVEDITPVGSLYNLEKLSLRSCSGIEDITPIFNLSHLKFLDLCNCYPLPSLDGFSYFKELRELNISLSLKNYNCFDLGCLTNLSKLHVRTVLPFVDSLKELFQSKQLNVELVVGKELDRDYSFGYPEEGL
ncbi:hypothetical protein RCL1_001568 [Eukaryota sp. TZLM3-RCL]